MNLSRYKSTKLSLFILALLLVAFVSLLTFKKDSLMQLFSHNKEGARTKILAPTYHSNTSIEEALKLRRSTREYKADSLTLQQVSQLLWAAQGLTSATGFRTAPSAGGLYPLEIYLVSNNIQDLPAGVYHYLPFEQALELVASGDKRKELATVLREQNDNKLGAAEILITGSYKKDVQKYGSHGDRFVHMEAGHVAENVQLQGVSLGIGTVPIATFDEGALKRLLGVPKDLEAFYVMPLGKI